MKLNKILKIFSIIFECSTIGSIVLYIYNFYTSNKKYEVIPETIKTRLNLFLIIGVFSLILFLVIKYVLYLRNKTISDEIKEEEPSIIENTRPFTDRIEDNIVERVIIHKDSYDVPKERRAICPNCGNIVDMNATICLKCGFLLKEIVREKVIEKHVYNVKDSINFDKNKLKNIIINTGLVVAIVVCLIFIINIAIERGIIA